MQRRGGVLECCCLDEWLIFIDKLGAMTAARHTIKVVFMVASTVCLKLMCRNQGFE